MRRFYLLRRFFSLGRRYFWRFGLHASKNLANENSCRNRASIVGNRQTPKEPYARGLQSLAQGLRKNYYFLRVRAFDIPPYRKRSTKRRDALSLRFRASSQPCANYPVVQRVPSSFSFLSPFPSDASANALSHLYKSSISSGAPIVLIKTIGSSGTVLTFVLNSMPFHGL